MPRFYDWIIFHCVDVPWFPYPLISWGTSWSLPFEAIMNNAAINIYVQVFMWTDILNLGKNQGAQTPDRVVRLCLAWSEATDMSPEVAVPLCVPTSNGREFLLLRIRIEFGIIDVSDFSHSGQCMRYLVNCFSLQFPTDAGCGELASAIFWVRRVGLIWFLPYLSLELPGETIWTCRRCVCVCLCVCEGFS